MRGMLVGAALVVAVGAVSASALVFQSRDDPSSSLSSKPRASATTTSSSSTTTTTSTTSTTTTTAAPAPPPTAPPVAAAPAPAPEAVFTPPPPPAVSFCDGSGSGVIDAMNGDRGANGLGALCGNSQLHGIAQNWANWMAQNTSLTHQDLNAAIGPTPFSAMGENILVGPGGLSVGEMESAWMQSPSHRANILSGAYSAAGVGIAYSSDGRIWVAVDFGG